MPLFELLPERIVMPLLPGGLIEPEGVTILYGSPGSRKGVVAAWQIMELTRIGYKVAILDFEGRERQWRLRMQGIPHNTLYYHDCADPIDTMQGEIETEILEGFNPHVLVIDSGSMAVPELRGMNEAACVRKLYRILKDWKRPAFLLHHVSKADMRSDDALPLGTVQWYAQARLAINIDTGASGLTRLTFRKANDRSLPDTIHCRWDWSTNHMEIVEAPKPEPSLGELVITVLQGFGSPMTVDQIVDALKREHPPASIRTSLTALRRKGQVVRSFKGKDTLFGLV